MKHAFRNILIATFAAALIPGCSKESVRLESGGPILFNVSGSFDARVETKATEVTTANLTEFYVTATTGTIGSNETDVFSSVSFTGTPGGAYTGGKYWPSSDPGYHFFASSLPMTFSASTCTVAATTATDVICSYVESPTYKANNTLTFSHILGRVGTLSVSASDGYTLYGLTVKITPKVSGTYNLRTGAGHNDGTGWSGVAEGAEATLSSSDNQLYVVPGEYVLTFNYTLTKGDYVEVFTKTATISVLSGVTNNISCTLPSGRAQGITVSVSLTSWSSQDHQPTFS